MSRRAFTLVELLVAIMLLGLVVLFLVDTLNSVRIGESVLRTQAARHVDHTRAIELLYADILQITDDTNETILIEGDKHMALAFRTQNSLYGINRPYVKWFVDPKTQRLLRSESAKEYKLPYDNAQLHLIRLDKIMESCEWLRAYEATEGNDTKSLLVVMQCEKAPQPFVLEFLRF
ncbi:MAG: hypothetical protein KU37_04075 [Sulfuricurvum sp. PC08-66]|nr:MAG: hypothetical protein KU37_04075 [Sulfuricurvum sp. PC08-66]